MQRAGSGACSGAAGSCEKVLQGFATCSANYTIRQQFLFAKQNCCPLANNPVQFA